MMCWKKCCCLTGVTLTCGIAILFIPVGGFVEMDMLVHAFHVAFDGFVGFGEMFVDICNGKFWPSFEKLAQIALSHVALESGGIRWRWTVIQTAYILMNDWRFGDNYVDVEVVAWQIDGDGP